MSQSSSHSSSSLQQAYPQYPQGQQHPQHSQHLSDAGGQSQQFEADSKESKPRRERRERSRRDRSSRQSHQQQGDSREEMSNSNDGPLKQQQQQPQHSQQPHRVIVDPNSFQRQILQPNPNSNGGGERKLVMTGGSGRDGGELYDDDSRGSDVIKSGSRRQAPAGRTVYSWQGTCSSQQQQQQQHQNQHEQHHHPQHQALRGPVGPYSQPGFKDPRSMTAVYSGGGTMSTGGRPMPSAPIAAMPPVMGSSSVKLMNEGGKILGSAEQWLSDHPGHFIVGILGTQGAGKSTLLSSFCPSPLASAAFTKQTSQMASVAGFQTSGVDMYITPERMILLDTEPIFSLSNLENALRNERIPDGIPVDLWLDHQALVMATFLVSVCNVVLIMTENRSGESSQVLKLFQRVEVFMKALSAASSSSNLSIAAQGASVGGAGQPPSMGQEGPQREGLGDWCADIVLVSNKVPTIQFGPDYYYRVAQEQAFVLQHTTLQLFGSINMSEIYARFEDVFKTARNSSGVASNAQRKRISVPSASTSPESLSSDAESAHAKQDKDTVKDEIVSQQKQQQRESADDDRRAAQHLNLVILPFDSTMAPGTPPISNKTKSITGAGKLSAASQPTTLESAMSHLTVSFNRNDILGASLKSSSHDLLGSIVQDQERWKVWAKGLRNKVLSLSMRSQGGPALGPRNRPGMVSEREWLRYASRSWETIRKADFLSEFALATKLSREG
ncbi:smg-9, nonsense mediated mRNA decay factor [Gamsiella multidivaricata]|nr:smg-9, nonsense mediated mRNA decay factor [Gamsiella multidivaricata]